MDVSNIVKTAAALEEIEIPAEYIPIAEKLPAEIFHPGQAVSKALNGIVPTVDVSGSSRSIQFAQLADEIKADASSLLSIFEVVLMVAGVVLAGLLVWFLFKKAKSDAQAMPGQAMLAPLFNKEAIKSKWDEIQRHLSSYRDAEWKFAVVEADKLTDDVLQKSGFAGEDMGERLMGISKYQLKTLGNLWDAHKLRNLVVHNMNFQVKHNEVRYAIEQYEKALKELGALD